MIGKEAVEQIKVREWVIQNTDLPFLHIANERQCSVQIGLMLKRMGVVRGVSDIFMPRGNGKKSGLWIELKTKTGRPSSAQLDFISKMIDENYAAFVAYGANEAILIIKAFYGLE